MFEIVLASLLIFAIYSCSDDNVIINTGPALNSINGTVTFVDTNFVLTGGTYLISAFGTWPPMGPPSAYDTIHITRTNNILNRVYQYQLADVSPGSYAVSVGFRKTTGGASPVLSVYGCDTVRPQYSPCPITASTRATIGANNEGTEGINMISWSDTTKKIF